MIALSPVNRASTARTSSRVKTTGSRSGFLARGRSPRFSSGRIKHNFIEEEKCAERLILRRGRNIPLDGKMGKERTDFGLAHLQRMPFPVKKDELFDPVHIGILGADAVMQCTDLFTNLIE